MNISDLKEELQKVELRIQELSNWAQSEFEFVLTSINESIQNYNIDMHEEAGGKFLYWTREELDPHNYLLTPEGAYQFGMCEDSIAFMNKQFGSFFMTNVEAVIDLFWVAEEQGDDDDVRIALCDAQQKVHGWLERNKNVEINGCKSCEFNCPAVSLCHGNGVDIDLKDLPKEFFVYWAKALIRFCAENNIKKLKEEQKYISLALPVPSSDLTF